MKIEYIIPSNILDFEKVSDYFRKYVQPLGRPRTTVRLVSNELLLESDRPSMLVLANRLIGVAFDLNWEYIMEPLQNWSPPGGWCGDTERDTPEFALIRHGPPLRPLEKFVYEPPPYERDRADLESVSELAVGMSAGMSAGLGDNHRRYMKDGFYMKADANSLISLAKQFIYLSQPEVPVGERAVYAPTFEYDPKTSRFIIVRSEFRQDVPWAGGPSDGT